MPGAAVRPRNHLSIHDVLEGEAIVSGMSDDELMNMLVYCARKMGVFETAALQAPSPPMMLVANGESEKARSAVVILYTETMRRLSSKG